MGPRKRGVSLYEAVLATIIVVWFMNRAGALSRVTPVIILNDVDYGFYMLHFGVLIVVWLGILFIETALDVPMFIHHMRSNQGTSAYLDILVLVTSLYVLIMAFGADILWRSPYLIAIPVVSFLAAFISLLTGRERSRDPVFFQIPLPQLPPPGQSDE